MNHTLMATYGDIGINAFAIISYLSSFTMSVFFGASEGMQPLFGQAYGAKEDDKYIKINIISNLINTKNDRNYSGLGELQWPKM